MLILLVALTGLAGAAALFNFRWAFFLFLFFYHAYPEAFAVGVGSEGYALSLQRTVLYVLLATYLMRLALGSADTLRGLRILKRQRRVFYPLVALIVIALLSTILNRRVEVSSISAFSNLFFFSLFIVLMVVTTVRNVRDARTVFVVVTLAVLLNEAIAVAEQIKGSYVLADIVEIDYKVMRDRDLLAGRFRGGDYRVMGSYTNPLKLAVFLCQALPAVLFLVAERKWRGSKWAAIVALGVGVPVIFWTGSRAGLVALVFALWYWTAFRPGSLGGTSGRMLRLGASLLLLGFVAYLARDAIVYSAVQDPEGLRSLAGRVRQFEVGKDLISVSPIFGYGMSRNVVDLVGLHTLDNSYLRCALETGLLGVGAFLLFLACAWSMLRRSEKGAESPETRHVLFSLKASFVVGLALMFAVSMLASFVYLYVVIGLAAVLEEERTS